MTDWDDITARLEGARNYWLCTASPDGRPHAAPLWGVWLDGALVVSTGPRTAKGRNLAANPRAVVHLESGDDVVVLETSVEVLHTGRRVPPGHEALVTAYADKYAVDGEPVVLSETDMEMVVARLVPQLAHAWTEQDFLASRRRWVRRDGRMVPTPVVEPG